jgi:hypothetical protein
MNPTRATQPAPPAQPLKPRPVFTIPPYRRFDPQDDGIDHVVRVFPACLFGHLISMDHVCDGRTLVLEVITTANRDQIPILVNSQDWLPLGWLSAREPIPVCTDRQGRSFAAHYTLASTTMAGGPLHLSERDRTKIASAVLSHWIGPRPPGIWR